MSVLSATLRFASQRARPDEHHSALDPSFLPAGSEAFCRRQRQRKFLGRWLRAVLQRQRCQFARLCQHHLHLHRGLFRHRAGQRRQVRQPQPRQQRRAGAAPCPHRGAAAAGRRGRRLRPTRSLRVERHSDPQGELPQLGGSQYPAGRVRLLQRFEGGEGVRSWHTGKAAVALCESSGRPGRIRSLAAGLSISVLACPSMRVLSVRSHVPCSLCAFSVQSFGHFVPTSTTKATRMLSSCPPPALSFRSNGLILLKSLSVPFLK